MSKRILILEGEGVLIPLSHYPLILEGEGALTLVEAHVLPYPLIPVSWRTPLCFLFPLSWWPALCIRIHSLWLSLATLPTDGVVGALGYRFVEVKALYEAWG